MLKSLDRGTAAPRAPQRTRGGLLAAPSDRFGDPTPFVEPYWYQGYHSPVSLCFFLSFFLSFFFFLFFFYVNDCEISAVVTDSKGETVKRREEEALSFVERKLRVSGGGFVRR